MATKNGIIKKTSLEAFSRPRPSGIIAANVNNGDELIAAEITSGDSHVLLGTKNGMSIRFNESDVRSMGRIAAGVKGIRLAGDDEVVGMVVVNGDEGTLLTVSEGGYGKRTEIAEYRVQSRGGKGIINLKITEKTGKVVAIMHVKDHDEVMLVARSGQIIRLQVQDVRPTGRATQGVRLIRLENNDRLAAVARLAED